jgi:hypothetical protein
MYMQRVFLISALFLNLFAGGQAEARKKDPVDTFERVTDWVPVSKSMSELLNEGWKIVGFNDYQTEMFSDNISSHTFIVASGNRYIICFLIGPAMNDAKSKCRALN